VTPLTTIFASHKIGAPARMAPAAASAKPGENTMSSASSTMPEVCTRRTATRSSRGEKRPRFASLRMMANERR
jgi:hypothetical protein